MEKPITFIIFETKKAIAETIQESGLPIYIIEPIMKELYSDIKMMNEQKLQEDMEQYRKACKEDTADGQTHFSNDSGNEK